MRKTLGIAKIVNVSFYTPPTRLFNGMGWGVGVGAEESQKLFSVKNSNTPLPSEVISIYHIKWKL